MRITIDTKEDRPEEIRKAIDMLMKVLDMSPSTGISGGSYGENPETPQPSLFNIFNDEPKKTEDYPVEKAPEKEDFNVGNYTEEPQNKDKQMRPYF